MSLNQLQKIKQLEDENWRLKVKLSLMRRAFRSVRVELIHSLVLNSELKNKMHSAVEKEGKNDSTK